jgi:hypothetical protein
MFQISHALVGSNVFAPLPTVTQVVLEATMPAFSGYGGKTIQSTVCGHVENGMGAHPMHPNSGLPKKGQPHFPQVIYTLCIPRGFSCSIERAILLLKKSLAIRGKFRVGQESLCTPKGMDCMARTEQDSDGSVQIDVSVSGHLHHGIWNMPVDQVHQGLMECSVLEEKFG